MTHFPDLSPYAYGQGSHPGVVHVGWLDGVHSFPTGAVDARLIKKLRLLSANPVELYRGYHHCEVCRAPSELVKTIIADRMVMDPNCSWAIWHDQRKSNGEIRVSLEGVVFAAPILIIHYIEEHGYLPPAQFLEAVEQAVC